MRWAGGSTLLCLVLLSGCAARNLAEHLLLGGRPDVVENLSYGENSRQRLDVYRTHNGPGSAPVIVFLYGGRWQHGSRGDYRLLGNAISRQGLVAVVPDYRIYPAARFPDWIQDAARVVRWVQDSIGSFGGDPARVFVVGHSAGAHTTALLALDEQYLRAVGLSANAVQGFASLAGPVATEWTDPDVQALMGPREQWSMTYPLEYVDGSEKPLLLLHGGKDKVVAAASSLRLAAQVRERGGCVRLKVYPGLGHIGIVIALSLPLFDIAPVLDEVIRFVRRPDAVCRHRS